MNSDCLGYGVAFWRASPLRKFTAAKQYNSRVLEAKGIERGVERPLSRPKGEYQRRSVYRPRTLGTPCLGVVVSFFFRHCFTSHRVVGTWNGPYAALQAAKSLAVV